MADSGIEFINVRHEQVAAHAADGYARVTRKASVLLTHLGPGLTNAATGVANAALDCIPMVVIAGDVPSHYFGKHPHQEVNLHADGAQYEIYRPFVKRAWRVDDPKLFPEIIDKAFLLAESGQPGPVLVDVPMDVFSAEVDSRAVYAARGQHARVAQTVARSWRPRAKSSRRWREAQRAAAVRGRRRRAGRCLRGTARLRRSPRHSRGAQPHGQGRAARRSSAAARHERLLGHEAGERHLPRRRLGAGTRHALQGSRLQLLVSRLHVQHSADAPHPHRHRAQRDRPQLRHRDRRGGRSQAGAAGSQRRWRARCFRRRRKPAKIADTHREVPPRVRGAATRPWPRRTPSR